jgi:hypothetical protein
MARNVPAQRTRFLPFARSGHCTISARAFAKSARPLALSDLARVS